LIPTNTEGLRTMIDSTVNLPTGEATKAPAVPLATEVWVALRNPRTLAPAAWAVVTYCLGVVVGPLL
jgi:hypothetical protein